MIARWLGLIALLGPVSLLPAQTPPELSKTIAVQRAISAAREYLRKAQPANAIQVLEAELVNADGNASYLQLLKDAYAARIRELRLAKADTAKIQEVENRLRLFEGKDRAPSPPPLTPPLGDEPARLKAPTAPTPPAIPLAPDEMYPPAPALGPTPIVAPTTPATPADEPPVPAALRQDRVKAPREEPESPTESIAQRASFAFQSKAYTQAATLFADADQKKEPLTTAQRDEWAYARLYQVATKLNRGDDAPATLTGLAQEVDAALRTGSDRLLPFGNQLLQEIRRRGGPVNPPAEEVVAEPIVPTKTPAPISTRNGEWQAVNGKSVRVLHLGKGTLAAEIALVADTARTAMYERWAGPAAADWSPKCDIYLHPTGADYAKATHKAADHLGHCTVNIKGGQVIARRLDLRADDTTLLDATLPHEITQMVLADLFAEQLLPRWATVGIASLSESPENVARSKRALPDLLKGRKLFAVGPLLEMTNFPTADAITPFYAQSTSLVGYLVELRGPKAFIAFLREAPRRGYAKALTTHYGFRDPTELQEQWLKHVMGADRD